MLLPKRNFDTSDPAAEKNLDAAVRDGMSFSVMVGAGETYLGPFGIFLKASAVQLGILAALPPFFGALCQVFSLKLMQQIRSRRFLIVAGVRLQALSFLPLLILPFLFSDAGHAVPYLIIVVMLYYAGGGFSVPLWSSLIGDLVPAELRGRYFGYRNQRSGLCAFFAMLVAGLILDFFAAQGMLRWGFVAIFLIAFIARLNSAYWLSHYDDPEFHSPPEAYFTFWRFLTRARYSNFARFVFFFSGIHFGAALSAPYFAVYMLRDLQFPYWEFTLITATVTLTQIFTLHQWGRIADRFGSKKILTLCSFGVSLSPTLWLFSTSVWYLMLVQVYSGIVWAGFNLAASTFLFDAVSSPKRARCAAYQALVQGAFILGGSLSGGYIVQHVLPNSVGLGSSQWTPRSPLIFLFLISGTIRLVAASVFRRRFSEVREVAPAKSLGLLFHLFPLESVLEGAAQIVTVTFRRPPRKTSKS